MSKITYTNEQLSAEERLELLKAEIEAVEAEVEAGKKIELKSEGKKYQVMSDFSRVLRIISGPSEEAVSAGLAYQFHYEAEYAAKVLRRTARLIARGAEIAIELGAAYEPREYILYLDRSIDQYGAAHYPEAWLIPLLSESVAEQLCEELNNGRFDLDG